MWYTVETFLPCYKKLLESTTHYIGMSSGAVCADYDQPITEDMPRVIDICSDEEKATSREYHMEKARIEDILKDSSYKNWTLIRPHVTYNVNRLPLFVWEKEQWFYRILQGHTIVLTKDMLDKRTVLTYGGDVARVIAMLIKKEGAYGQVINVTSDHSMERREIVATYQKIFEESFHQKMKIRYLENVEELRRAFPYQADRMDNDRMLNRVYDTTKLKRILGEKIVFSDFYESMKKCCEECFAHIDINHLRYRNGFFCSYMDRMSNESTPLRYFGMKDKVKYVLGRTIPSYEFLMNVIFSKK